MMGRQARDQAFELALQGEHGLVGGDIAGEAGGVRGGGYMSDFHPPITEKLPKNLRQIPQSAEKLASPRGVEPLFPA